MLYFDLETNGLMDTCTKIHSLVIYDDALDKMYSCANQEGYIPLELGYAMLERADVICAHNGIKFDLEALAKVTGKDFWLDKKILDSLNFSRLVYPQLALTDTIRWRSIPKKLVGWHSLEAWGERLKFQKGNFGKQNSWEEWSKPMQDYCEQDVLLLVKLVQYLKSKGFSDESIWLEMDFQKIIWKQEKEGFPFDLAEAERVDKILTDEKARLTEELGKYAKFSETKKVFIPKRDDAKKGYVAGMPFIKVSKIPFNYNSRDQVVKYFKEKYNWKPIDFTDKGKPQLNAEVMRELPWEESELFAKYFDVVKVQGRVSQGDSAWIKKTVNGRIHAEMTTNGAVTGRGTHKIISNIPRPDKYLGKEVRSMFLPPEGMVQVGCDAKAIELRNLAHYLYPYDRGAFVKVVTEGDVHTDNQQKAELPTRDNAKTFIYGFLYGAGDEKLGLITHPEASPELKKAHGKKLRTKFLSGFPALAMLIRDVKGAVRKRKYLIGLDGRQLDVRSEHSALNTLLQSAGAIIMKRATIIAWELFKKEGFKYGQDVVQLIHYHDEYQFGARPEIAERVGELSAEAIELAGDYYNFKCPLAGDYKIGKNWYECH